MTRTAVLNVRNILEAPLSSGNWYKKVVLWPLVVFVGLPLYLLAFWLAMLPLLLGGGLLLVQSYLYLEEGKWHSFSILDVATHTVDRQLANEIGEPLLASCEGLRGRLTPGSGAPLKEPCPDLSSWGLWLIQPHSWFGLHEILLPLLNLASMPGLVLIVGLFLRSRFKQLSSSVRLAARGALQTQIQPQQR